MGNEIQTTTMNEIEKVLVSGDLTKMTPDQRTAYYMQVCDALGLNPWTRPFDYLQLSGKLTLYANKNATEQLRRIYGVSITDIAQLVHGEILTVTVKGIDKEGRQDVASGTVCLTGLRGDNLANAYLKAETKAKRRLTLSICGLGMLDETEVETIPAAKKVEAPAPIVEVSKPATQKFGQVVKQLIEKYNLSYKDFTEGFYDIVLPYYSDLASVRDQSWKEKGAAIGQVFESSDQGDREAMISTARSFAEKMAAEATEDVLTNG